MAYANDNLVLKGITKIDKNAISQIVQRCFDESNDILPLAASRLSCRDRCRQV